MAAQPTPASQIISETAKAEGGPHKGSLSAQMQSQIGKSQNFEYAAQEVGKKIQHEPGSVTSEDAAYLKSREARAIGQANPPKDSSSADAERLASANERIAKSQSAPLDPVEQSAIDRANNFQDAAESVMSKMASEPEHVSKEEAVLLHRREQRAFGSTSKGGVASQAQSLAAENEKKGTV